MEAQQHTLIVLPHVFAQLVIASNKRRQVMDQVAESQPHGTQSNEKKKKKKSI